MAITPVHAPPKRWCRHPGKRTTGHGGTNTGESYAALECRKVSQTPLGDHTWFTGEVVAAWWDPEAFTEGMPDDVTAPLLYLGSNTYATMGRERIGH